MESQHIDHLLAITIRGHRYGCPCAGCERKRGRHPKETRGEAFFDRRHNLRLAAKQKQFVDQQGGNEYIRSLIDRDMVDKSP